MIGIAHGEREGAWSNEDIVLALGDPDNSQHLPVVSVNAERQESVIDALVALGVALSPNPELTNYS
jgi:hypothetical protein